MTNCATRKYFYCPETRTAARLGADLGGSYSTDGTELRHYKDGSTWNAPVDVDNPFADELRNLAVGQCYVRRHSTNNREQISPLTDPFKSFVVDGLRTAIKRRPEYFAPENPDDPGNGPPAASDSTPPQPPDDDSPFGIF